ncbi:MAG: hypothetical protein K0R57_6652, partial [Paenibacillaceae bacterium]|nr:hypothetical protein [Paenibacillaceae bacterium]
MDINLSFVAGTLPAGENGMNLEESPVRRFLTKLASGEDAAIVCAGDSVTWGQHYTTADRTYTARLAELLASRFPRATVCRYDGIYLEENSPIYSYGFPVT